MGGHFGAFLGADAHQPFLGEVLGDPHEIGARQQRDADDDRERGLQHRAEMAHRPLQHDDAGHPDADQQHTGRAPQHRQHALAAAELQPLRTAGVVGLAPHQGDTGADQQHRPDIALGLAQLEAEAMIAAPMSSAISAKTWPLSGLCRRSSRFPCGHGGVAVVHAADTQGNEEPESGVQQRAHAVGQEEGDEHDPHPGDRQPEMPRQAARDTTEQPPVGAAVQLAHGRFVGVRCRA